MSSNPVAVDAERRVARELVSRSVIELDVGGTHYTTLKETLLGHNLNQAVANGENGKLAASQGRTLFQELFGPDRPGQPAQPQSADSPTSFLFLDRDGPSFRHILSYLRTGQLILPSNFDGLAMLKVEAEYYRLPGLVAAIKTYAARNRSSGPGFLRNISGDLQSNSVDDLTGEEGQLALSGLSLGGPDVGVAKCPNASGYLTVAYRGTFAFGRDGQADVKFRKMSRILVCGRVNLCREVFGDTLNESRDPDRGHYDRYSSRFFLKHNFLEQAFDDLQRAGFRCTGCCGTSTSSSCKIDMKQAQDNEENKWNHYNEFVFVDLDSIFIIIIIKFTVGYPHYITYSSLTQSTKM